MKVAHALVVGADLDNVAYLRNVASICREGLEPYQREIRAVEEMYKSIWQFHAYVDREHLAKAALVTRAFEHEVGFPNDQLLALEYGDGGADNPYDVLALRIDAKLGRQFHPRAIARLDEMCATRQRLGNDAGAADAMVEGAIGAVLEEITSESHGDQPSITSRRSRNRQMSFAEKKGNREPTQ